MEKKSVKGKDQFVELCTNLENIGISKPILVSNNVTKNIFMEGFENLRKQVEERSKNKRNLLILVINSLGEEKTNNLIMCDYNTVQKEENSTIPTKYIYQMIRDLNFVHTLFIFTGTNIDFKEKSNSPLLKFDIESSKSLVSNSFKNGYFVIQKRSNTIKISNEFFESINKSLVEVIQKNEIYTAKKFYDLITLIAKHTSSSSSSSFGEMKKMNSEGIPIITNFLKYKSISYNTEDNETDIIFSENYHNSVIKYFKGFNLMDFTQKNKGIQKV
eukprot:TRINITY_DN7711_c0_g1_i1.p1 TRINITY_DN7711_c0_g1~~TRINITY_DN7711_c0_g1_i1.p1  ORF type:complete len:292 (+),score=64.59 TRINITY_DN7711_c0_g1_i1:58-876(+)